MDEKPFIRRFVDGETVKVLAKELVKAKLVPTERAVTMAEDILRSQIAELCHLVINIDKHYKDWTDGPTIN